MPNSIGVLLEKLAERCISTAAGMLATTIASLQISHDAERQQQLEELAKDLDEQGLTEVARTLRERAQLLTVEDPAPPKAIPGSSGPQGGLIGANGTLPLRRTTRRTKRSEGGTSAPKTPSDTSADASLFFPLNAQPNNQGGESEQA
jgi:hypothetical protein